MNKIALDALKARTMAQKLGLVPAMGSAWKWALRNMRDGRGDLLEGKALGDAKLALGKLPNNTRQKVEAIARLAGGNKEIATSVRPNNPAHNISLQTGKIHRNQLPDLDTTRRMERGEALSEHGGTENEISEAMFPKVGPYRIGTNTYTTFGSTKDFANGEIGSTIHTHPTNRFFGQTMERYLGKATRPLTAGHEWIKDLPWEEYQRHMKSRKIQLADIDRVNATDHRHVDPSGYITRPSQTMGGPNREFTSADYRGYLDVADHHPHANHTILNPESGYEGIHRLRPDEGLRSIYFKNRT